MTDTATARWEQYNEAGRRAFGQGQLADAEEYFQAAIREAEVLGSESPQLAASLNTLGQLRLQARDLVGAERHLRRSLAIREKVYGAEHHALVSSLNNLGALHDAKGELDQAENALRRALAICEQQLQPSHPDLALALNNLARLHFKRRDFPAADRLFLRLLELKRALGKDHPEVATVLGVLGKLRHAVGRNEQAEQLWRQALAIRERAFAPNDPILATTLESLADCCAPQTGRIADAIAHRERALEIRLTANGPSHPSIATAQAKLDELRRRAGGDPPPSSTLSAPPPPPRISNETPSPVTSQDVAGLTGNRPSGGAALPWLDPEQPPGERISQQIELASVEPQVAAPPPARSSPFPEPPRPAPLPPLAPLPPAAPVAPPQLPPSLFAPAPPAPRDLGISEGFAPSAQPPRPAPPPPRRSSGARQAPRRPSEERREVRFTELETPRRRGRARGFATALLLLGMAGGGWYSVVRGYVHPLTILSRVFELVARNAPSVEPAKASAASTPRRPAPQAPEIVVPESLVSASTEPGAATDNSASRDSVSDDALHPKVKVVVDDTTGDGAYEIDALSRSIDRSTQSKLDSADRARIEAKLPVVRKP